MCSMSGFVRMIDDERRNRLRHARGVSPGLATGCRRNHDHVVPAPGGIDGLCLVHIELACTKLVQNLLQRCRQGPSGLCIPRRSGWDVLKMHDLLAIITAAADVFHELVGSHGDGHPWPGSVGRKAVEPVGGRLLSCPNKRRNYGAQPITDQCDAHHLQNGEEQSCAEWE